jgi:hypothetical protein
MSERSDTPRTDKIDEANATGADYVLHYARMRSFARQLERECAALQEKIDALMFEYCPEEMTPEQIAEWGKHQKAIVETKG